MDISFDDFKKLDIRIGTITSAERVPETDKLVKLTVDIGEEAARTIVAGIAEYVSDLETLVGKQTQILTNLEPRELRGVTSQGMLLGVGGEGFTLLTPEESVVNGAQVR